MADEQIHQCRLPIATSHKEVAKPCPIHGYPDQLKPKQPPTLCLNDAPFPQETIRVGIEIESSEGQDKVVDLVLDGEEVSGGKVECHDTVVIGRIEGGKKCGANSEERNMLDIGVMCRMVRHHCQTQVQYENDILNV